jgi:hypothetical protein
MKSLLPIRFILVSIWYPRVFLLGSSRFPLWLLRQVRIVILHVAGRGRRRGRTGGAL